jgi:hypothetical protein
VFVVHFVMKNVITSDSLSDTLLNEVIFVNSSLITERPALYANICFLNGKRLSVLHNHTLSIKMKIYLS